MPRLRQVVALMVTLPALAFAGSRTTAVAVGDCANGDLVTGMTSFESALRARLGADAWDGEQVLAIVRPRAERSLEDLQRQVETARTLFYSGQHERALDQLKQALTELDLVSPHLAPWKTTKDALLLQSLAYKALGRVPESKEAQTRLLRVEPDAALDATLYTPSFISAFDALKRQAGRSKKSQVRVTSTPAGATVVLDGRAVGKTPLTLPLLPGRYRVALVDGKRASFSRTLAVAGAEDTTVDFAFEGAVSLVAPVCIDGGGAPEALKLAALVGADQVVVFLLDSARGDPSYFRATLYSVPQGSRIREGGVRRKGAGGFDDLVTFVVTGQQAPGVLTAEALQTSQEPKPPAAEGPKPDATKPAPPEAVAAKPTASRASPVGWGLVAGGAALAVTGVVAWSFGAGDRDRLAALTDGSGKLVPPESTGHREALDLMPKVDANRTLAFGLAGAGLGAALAGAGVLFFAPNAPVQVSLQVGPDGAGLGVAGGF